MMSVRARLGAGLVLVALAGLVGCAGSVKPKPEPLQPLTPTLAIKQAWSVHVSGVEFPLSVAVTSAGFAVASDDGTVLMLEPQSGAEVWRGKVDDKLSAGVGSEGRYAAVVTREGELVVLDQGRVKWRKLLGARVVTAPLVAGERVFVVGVDRTTQAFDVLDGRKLWVLARPGDPLTLAQSGVLGAFKDTLIVGQGARMAGVEPLRGTVRWDAVVGSPRGANEIERLADLVGPMARVGDLVCARSFQAAVGCVDAERGTTVWSRNVGGIDAVAADAHLVVAADASDRITAWKTPTGEVAWTTDKLLYRTLGSPLLSGRSVVFGDADGTVHWLASESGEAQLRLPTDGGAIMVAPVQAAGTTLVVTRRGGLFGFRP